MGPQQEKRETLPPSLDGSLPARDSQPEQPAATLQEHLKRHLAGHSRSQAEATSERARAGCHLAQIAQELDPSLLSYPADEKFEMTSMRGNYESGPVFDLIIGFYRERGYEVGNIQREQGMLSCTADKADSPRLLVIADCHRKQILVTVTKDLEPDVP